MIADQRRALIVEFVRRHGGGSIIELAKDIGVSASTVRRDLDFLMQGAIIVRRHGGAVLDDMRRTTFEPQREIDAHLAHSAKVGDWGRAAELIEHGQSVIFNSSSTVRRPPCRGQGQIRLTACTNDIATGGILAGRERLQLVVLGGTKRPGSLTLIGDPGMTFLERLHADVALMGIHSLYADGSARPRSRSPGSSAR